ncbi:MAG: hypothetical protein V7724_08200, partial [Sediminicola sp.]
MFRSIFGLEGSPISGRSSSVVGMAWPSRIFEALEKMWAMASVLEIPSDFRDHIGKKCPIFCFVLPISVAYGHDKDVPYGNRALH